MGDRAIAWKSAFVTQERRLRLTALPPEQDTRVGQICHVAVAVDTTDPAEVTISFPMDLFELISPASMHQVAPGTHRVGWALYTRAFSADPALIEVRARTAALHQLAEIRVRFAED